MIRFLRQHSIDALRRCFLEKRRKDRRSRLASSRGQVALVLILLAAIGLVLYAVILRYGTVSQTKTRVMISAQKAATGMASFMASYAQRLSSEYVRGGLSYCSSTSLLGRILLLVVLIIVVIVVSYFCPPAGFLGGPVFASLMTATFFVTISVALDALVIQPGITKVWNKMMANMSTEDYLIESAIQTAFMTAVNDNEPLPDFLDLGASGVAAKVGDWEANTTSRFVFYYTQRLRGIENPINLALEEFAKQLRRFVLVQDNPPPSGSPAVQPIWGLHDHLGLNPCGSSFNFPLGPGHNLMDECNVNNKSVEVEGTCTGSNCFYDPFFEFAGNTYFSFREDMGRDAERPYGVYSIGPLGTFYNYRVEDISGYYRADPRKREDGRPAIYLPLYMMQDIGVDLTLLRSLSTDYRYNCYWRHGGCATPYDPQHPDTGIRNPTIPELEPLLLPRLDTVTLEDSGGLSGRDMGFSAGLNDDALTGAPERLTHVDLVRPPALFFQDERTACGHDALEESTGRWKRGIDRFCSSQYPYNMECPKHSGCTEPDPYGGPAMDMDCFCPSAVGYERRFFPEDFLDDIFYGVWEFIEWAQVFLFVHSKDGGSFLARDFKVWYDQEASEWFEDSCAGGCAPGSTACCPGSYTKRNRKGGLIALEENIRYFYDMLGSWILDEEGNQTYEGEKSWGALTGTGYAAWCVPPHPSTTSQGPVEITQSELATFNAGGFYGDMPSVLSCMDWNLQDTTEFLNKDMVLIQSAGNQEKFAACRDHCGIRACSRIENYPNPWTTNHYGMTDPSRFDPFLPRTTVTFPGSGGSYPGLASYYFEAGDREWFLECSFAADSSFPQAHRKPPYNVGGTVWDYCREMCQGAPIDEYASEFGGPPPGGVEEFRANFFCQYHLNHPNVCYRNPASIAMNCYDATNITACLNWCPNLNNCNYGFRLTLSDWSGPRAEYYPEFCQDRFAEPVEGTVECGSLDDCGGCASLGWAAAEPDPEGLPLPDPVFTAEGIPMEQNGFVLVEAEDFYMQTNTSLRAWYITSATQTPNVFPDPDPPHVSGASGGAYVEVLPDTRVTDEDTLIPGQNFTEIPGQIAVLHYRVHVTTPGRYYVWVRAYSTGSEDNGIHVGLNGTWPASGTRMQWCSKNAWRWASRQRTEANHCGEPYSIYLDIPSAGEHEIMFSMREDGFEFDAFMLVQESTFAPEGAEPAYFGDYADPVELQNCLDAVAACQSSWYDCMSAHAEAEAAAAEGVASFMALLRAEANDDRFLRNQTRRFFEGVEILKDTADSPSCHPASSYLESIRRAMNAAENHMAKIAHRQAFLRTMLLETQTVVNIFGEASDRFAEFLHNRTSFIRGPAGSEFVLGGDHLQPTRPRVVRWWEDGGYSDGVNTVNVYSEAGRDIFSPYGVDSPVELLITERYREDLPKEVKDNTASVAVYVWRGSDMKVDSPRYINGQPTQMGYVHAVKVETRAPKRCNARCNLSGTGREGWPWIRTKTSRWGTRRCYYLEEYQGMTKARVIRYDEPMAETKPLFRFGNNVLIRGLRTAHPDMAADDSAAVQNVFRVCAAQIHPYVSGVGRMYAGASPDNPQYLEHAFMLNYVPDPSQDDRVDERYMSCWNYVHEHLLEKGTHVESCAQYYWQNGMNIRFAPCDAGFSSGQF